MPCPDEIVRLEDEAIGLTNKVINEKTIDFITGPNRILQSPIVEGLTSNSLLWKQSINNLFEHEFVLKKHIKGVGSDMTAEALIREKQAQFLQNGQKKVRQLYGEILGIPAGRTGAELEELLRQASPKLRKGKMSWTEFNREIDIAMRNGDVHPNPNVDPRVNKAAQMYRPFIDKATKELQEHGFLPEELELTTAQSYMMRRYNLIEIAKRQVEFKGLVRRHLSASGDFADDASLTRAVNDTVNRIKGQGEEKLHISDIADKFIDPDKKLPGIVRDRTLNIPDNELEPFLIHDATGSMWSFVNQAASLVAARKRLLAMGHSTLGSFKKAVADEYDKLIDEATDPKVREKLFGESQRALEAITNNFSITLGRFGTDHPTLSMLRKYLSTTMLGGILISSLPDIGIASMKHGIPRTLQDGFGALIKDFRQLKLDTDILKDYNIAIDHEMGTALRTQLDPSFKYGTLSNTPIERAIDTMSDVFTKSTFINWWNSWNTRVAARIGMARTVRSLRALEKTGKISEKEVTRLARLGIGKDKYKVIQRNFQFVEDIDGGLVLNTAKWDPEAQELLARAVTKDQVVLLPSKGDIPEFFQGSAIGKSMFMFKSFTAAATDKLFLPGLQRRGSEELQGLIAMTMLGALSYAIKQKINGKDVNTDIDRLLIEGATRSGVFGILGDLMFGPLGLGGATRFAGMTAQGAIGGPVLTTAGTVADLVAGLKDGTINESDRRKVAKLIGFNNVFYLKPVIQDVFVEGR